MSTDEQGRARPEILGFKPYAPGLSIEEIQEKYGLDNVIKLASNENPLGVSPLVRKALRAHADLAFRYPQSGNPRLLAALAKHLGQPTERIVAGNGSDEIIDLLIRVRAVPGRHNVLACRPSFSIYELQSRLCGVDFRQVDLEPGFGLPIDGLLAAADQDTTLCFVTSPDNPSGRATPAAELERLARGLPSGCLLVVDEAYMDFAEPLSAYSLLDRLDEFPNLVVLRTFSKMFALAGLRLGYGVMPEWLADYLWRVRLPFSVNILAEEAGIAALEDHDFFEATLDAVRQGRDYLARELAGLGWEVVPSQSNFLMAAPPRSGPSARDIFEALLARGIIVRPLASYGLPDRLRISVGNQRENRALMAVLKEMAGA